MGKGDIKRIVLDSTTDDGIILVHVINDYNILSSREPHVCINDLHINLNKNDRVNTIFGLDIIVDREDLDKYAVPSNKYRGSRCLTDAGKELINTTVKDILKIIPTIPECNYKSDRDSVIIHECKIVGDTADSIEYVRTSQFDAQIYKDDNTFVRENTLEILDNDLFIHSVEQLQRVLPYKLYSDGIIKFYTTNRLVRNYCDMVLKKEIKNGEQ